MIPARRLRLAAVLTLLAALTACSAPTTLAPAGQLAGAPAATVGAALAPTAETHTKAGKPNYAAAFPQDRVPAFKITIAPADWQAMIADMTKNYGERGQGGGPGGAGGVRRPAGGQAPGGQPAPGARPVAGQPAGMPPGGPGGMMGPDGAARPNPIWVPATISFGGLTWNHVGVRFKGNSSLSSAWRGKTDRLPFKIDFDQFEKEHPEIENQRFHGFKQLALSTNWNDPTSLRDATTYDLLADAGLPATETAFYELLLDRGEGEASLGVYTAVEVIDDTAIKRFFGGDKGNIYKGDGRGATLAEGMRGQIATGFEKKNNDDDGWSDVEALYDVLHDKQRTTDPAAWRKRLEAVFEVPGFLRWLAIAAAIQHWDTYGAMNHNFYLYNNPADGRLTWISWDHNLVLGAQGGPGREGEELGPPPGGLPPGDPPPPGAMPPPGMGMGGPGGGRSASLDRKDVASSWPLIRYLLDDPTYYAAYVQAMRGAADGPLQLDRLLARYQRLAAIVKPVAEKQPGSTSYDDALKALVTATETQVKAVRAFVDANP